METPPDRETTDVPGGAAPAAQEFDLGEGEGFTTQVVVPQCFPMMFQHCGRHVWSRAHGGSQRISCPYRARVRQASKSTRETSRRDRPDLTGRRVGDRTRAPRSPVSRIAGRGSSHEAQRPPHGTSPPGPGGGEIRNEFLNFEPTHSKSGCDNSALRAAAQGAQPPARAACALTRPSAGAAAIAHFSCQPS